MSIRKNTRRFDPRYFMDEKTEIIKEEIEKTELLKESLVDRIIQIINDSPYDLDNTDLHYAIGEKFPQLSDDQIDQAMNDKKLDPYYDSTKGVYSKNPKRIDLHGFKSAKETDAFVKKYPSFFNEDVDVEISGGGVRSVGGTKDAIIRNLEDAMNAAQQDDFTTVASKVAFLHKAIEALKDVGEAR